MSDTPEFFETFSIKLVALQSKELALFLETLCTAYQQHTATLQASKTSRNKNYHSFNLKLENIEKSTLDEIYEKLSKHKDIKWVI